jgi:hypothetical protein
MVKDKLLIVGATFQSPVLVIILPQGRTITTIAKHSTPPYTYGTPQEGNFRTIHFVPPPPKEDRIPTHNL